MEHVRSVADPLVVNNIIGQLKSKGFFDQFRRDCLADVDTKPAYQNLRQRVEGYVSNYLGQHKWEPGMNKNQLRDSLRRQINQSEMLATGVERVIEQVVEPKIQHIFRPQIEKLVKETLNPDFVSTSDNNANGVDNASARPTDIVAPPPEAPQPDAPSEPAPLPPPPPDEEDDDMDISTPSPTSSPDIRLSSPVDPSDEPVESPPPIPGVETDEAVDFDISQTVAMETSIETEEVPIAIEMETVSSSPGEGKMTLTEIQIEAIPEVVSAKTAALGSFLEEQKSDNESLRKKTQQIQIVDNLATEDISSTELPSTDGSDDERVIADDKKVSKKKKNRGGQDSDGESGLSDITVSSVHTSDLSSFDEEISSSSSESDESESSESSFSDKLGDDSKRGGAKQKSPRKAKAGEPVEVSYRSVKLAHRGQGWFLDKYIYVKNRENKQKIFLRCQHKYLCKAIAYIDKVGEKAYIKQGHHEHPPPDVRKITFGDKIILAVTKKLSEQDKPKKTSPKGKHKLAPIKLSLSKPTSPTSSKEALSPISSKEDGIFSEKDSEIEITSEIETPKRKRDDDSSPQSAPKTPLRDLTPAERRAEAARWAAYYEYSMAPASTSSRRSSTKALALSRYHSDSEDEDDRETRRKKAALDKEERARRRQEIRESGVSPASPPRPSPARPPRVRREQKEKTNIEEQIPEEEEDTSPGKLRSVPSSPVKATKAQLKEQKILEKKREMRRQRSLNKRYFSEEFSSPIQQTLKESHKVEDTKPAESQPLSPVKKPVSGKIKPRVLSFNIRFREKRVPQVESHFLLCSCLSGEQQKKMSSRKQKQRSRRAGKEQSKFSFIAKQMKKEQQQQRGRPRKTDDGGKGSDMSRSSTPVLDEMPVEPIDPAGMQEKRDGDSRSSTPVLDEVPGVMEEVSPDAQVKDETIKRKRGRPRKYADDGQEVSSRSSTPTPLQGSPGASNVDSASEQKRRGRPRKAPAEEPAVVEPMEEQVDNYSRSSTPVQDEMVVEEMGLVQNFGSIETVVIPTEQIVTESVASVVVGEQTIVQSEQAVEEMNVDNEPVEEMAVSEEPVQDQVMTIEDAERPKISGGDFWRMFAAVPQSSEVKKSDITHGTDQISDDFQTETASSEIHDKPDAKENFWTKFKIVPSSETVPCEDIHQAEDVDMIVEDNAKEQEEKSSDILPAEVIQKSEEVPITLADIARDQQEKLSKLVSSEVIQPPEEVEMVVEETQKLEDTPGVEESQQGPNNIQSVSIPEEVKTSEKSDDVQQKELPVGAAEKEESPVGAAEKEESRVAKKESMVGDPEQKELPGDDTPSSNIETGTSSALDIETATKPDEQKGVTEKVQSKVPPRPVVGHSPTPDEMAKEAEAKNGKEQADKVKHPDEKGGEASMTKAKDGDSDLVAVPAVGSSPTAVTIEEDGDDEILQLEPKETDKSAKVESKPEKEADLVVPALGQSPSGSPTQVQKDESNAQKMDVDTEDNPPNIADNPPTPTQDEPSSLDEISATEEDKPAIPVYAVASPSKSPLGVGRTVSQEGPSSSQGSPGTATSVTEESTGAEESEESAPSIRETRQRPKRRVSTALDSDFEYSRSKRSRNDTPTPPPPILEPELPIERPKEEETKTRTTRASKQKHISPPATPKESGVGTRTRHQSTQSNESQQSARTPSPVSAERVTRGRRSARQSESHRYSDMVYYDTAKKSQKQQSPSTAAASTAAASTSAAVGARRSSRRASDAPVTEKPTRGKRKR